MGRAEVRAGGRGLRTGGRAEGFAGGPGAPVARSKPDRNLIEGGCERIFGRVDVSLPGVVHRVKRTFAFREIVDT